MNYFIFMHKEDWETYRLSKFKLKNLKYKIQKVILVDFSLLLQNQMELLK